MKNVNYKEGKLDDESFIYVEAVNVGELSTTITHLAVYQFRTLLHKLFNRPKSTGVIIQQGSGYDLPYLLETGARWTGRIDQKDLINKTGNSGLLYCGIAARCTKKTNSCESKAINAYITY